jgi:glycosyltransferase involved in cell wall biosynthesis
MKCVNSILAQSNPNWKAVIFNDCSTDNTQGLLSEYYDPRLAIINSPVEIGNAAKCMNKMFELEIEAHYECKIDGDNELRPTWMEHMCTGENNFNYSGFQVDSIGTGRWREGSCYMKAGEIDYKVLKSGYPLGPSFCWNQSVRKRWKSNMPNGFIPETWGEDWVGAMLCVEAGATLNPIDTDLFLYREYPENASSRILGTEEQRKVILGEIMDMAKGRCPECWL